MKDNITPDGKRQSSGPRGEDEAARYLESQGYKILEANFRSCGSEVDLIALKDDTVCFVEVKTRGSDDCGLPEEFVNYYKRRKIIRAAKIYVAEEDLDDYFIRFDIVSIIMNGGRTEINHIPEAFDGGDV